MVKVRVYDVSNMAEPKHVTTVAVEVPHHVARRHAGRDGITSPPSVAYAAEILAATAALDPVDDAPACGPDEVLDVACDRGVFSSDRLPAVSRREDRNGIASWVLS